MSLTKVSYSMIQGATANVLDYGAVPGSDCTTAFQAALDSGQDVYVPTLADPTVPYLVTGLTMSKQGQTLFGAGPNSIIKLQNASNKSIVTVTANYVTIRDLGMDGNKANQTTTTDSFASGVWSANGVANLSVLNCTISNPKRNGIAGYGNHSYCICQNNRISGAGFIGIYPSSGSAYPFTSGVISNNTIQSPVQDGIGAVAIQSSIIEGNAIYQPGVSGISLEARCDFTTVTANTVVGDYGVSGSGRGLQINDSKGVSFIGNVICGCTEGISISGAETSQDVTVTGNTFANCGYNTTGVITASTSVSVSDLNAYDYGLVISNNIIADAQSSGVYMQSLRNVVISNNKIKNFNLGGETTNTRKMCGICLTVYAHDNLVQGNSITDATGGAYKVGIIELYDSGGGELAYRNNIVNNYVVGLNQDVLITFNTSQQSNVQRPARNTSAPNTFTWACGQIQYNSFPASGGSIGWVSTDNRGGSFGTLSGVTGSVNSGSSTITLSSTAGLFNGMSIAVAGAFTKTVIQKVNRAANTVDVVDAASGTVTGAAVYLYNPTFKTWGVIA